MLKVNHLSKRFGGLQAVNDLNFQIKHHAITALIGPNGAGKTTVFNLLTGMIKPDAGQIIFAGNELGLLKPYQIARLGIARTFQNLQIFSNMTALENVMTGMHLKSEANLFQVLLRLQKKEEKIIKNQSHEYLNLFNLGPYADCLACSLPIGIQRQIEIARALAYSPTLLLLDEPAAGLNPFETEELCEKIKKLISMGITILLIEHDMNLVMNISDFIIVLNFGEKIAEGKPEEIQRNKKVIDSYLGE